MKGGSPGLKHLFDKVDEGWLDHRKLIRDAFHGNLAHHGLYAEVVLRSPAVSEKIPYPLTAIFKFIEDTGHKAWYSCTNKTWVMTGDSALDVLKKAAEKICTRDLTDYHSVWSNSDEGTFFRCNLRWEFSGTSFQNGVKGSLGVSSDVFDVDGDGCRKYLNFCGRVFNAETLEWADMDPAMKITRSTKWRHQWPTWWETDACTELFDTLAEVKRQQDYQEARKLEYALSDAVKERLDKLCKAIPALEIFFTWTKEWESAIFELSLVCKGVFGQTQAAALWTRGVGRNGKDSLCNAMSAVLGTYSVSVAAQTLSRIRDPSAPSPAYALCRARRFVAVRQIDRSEPLRQQLYKVFTDPKSEMQGRDVYEKMVIFRPQFLIFFASNDPPALVNDLANRERTNIVEHVSVFHDAPVEANHVQWRDLEAMFETVEGKADFFGLFFAVYKQLLYKNPRRRIGRIPPKCLAFLEEEMQDKVLDAARLFLATKIERAPKGGATVKEDVYKALVNFINAHAPRDDGKDREDLRPAELLKQLGVIERRGKALGLNFGTRDPCPEEHLLPRLHLPQGDRREGRAAVPGSFGRRQ